MARHRLVTMVAMPRALILGGTGLVGSVTARRLLRNGWTVEVVGRHSEHVPGDLIDSGVRFFSIDRTDLDHLARRVGRGVDLLVDCVCFTANDAAGLLTMAKQATSTVMISSKAVYVDQFGNHVNSSTPPRFNGPISETQPTMAPGSGDYRSREGYGSNKVAAEQVLLDGDRPVTVIRPSKIHGPGASPPREWVFVKRCLDRRPAVLLADRGRGVDHPTAAANLAALIEFVAMNPDRRVLNSADPDAPSALEISRIIARLLDHHWEEVLLDDGVDPDLGKHPWQTAHPIVLDTTAATQRGYTPVGDYAATVGSAVSWMAEQARFHQGRAMLTGIEEGWFKAMLDYAAEDEYLAARAAR